MKQKILFYLFLLIGMISWNSCSNDDEAPLTPEQQLPPITTTGANTFGCLIDGKLFYPRDGYSGLGGSNANAISILGNSTTTIELDVNNFRDGKPINNFMMRLQEFNSTGMGTFIWNSSNFQHGIDGTQDTYLYIRAFNYISNSFKWYGSTTNSGSTIITKRSNGIISGTFSGTLTEAGETATVNITNGRFDINTHTVSDQSFP